jgi:hypothetical protein
MNDIDSENQQRLNTGLRLAVADFLDGGPGGLWGVWERPDRWHLEELPDLSATFGEHQMAGCDLREGIALLAIELAQTPHPQPELDLIGLALIWPGYHPRYGALGMCLARAGEIAHRVIWPAGEPDPVGEFRPTDELTGPECVAVVAALTDLLAAMNEKPAGNGGAR